MRRHFYEDVEVARRAAPQSCFAFPREPDAGARLDAGGNVHAERTVLLDPAGTAAGLAGVLDDLAESGTGRAGALDRKEALLGPHLSHSRTGGAGHGLGSGFRPRARTGVADDRCRNVDRFLEPRVGFFQTDPKVVAKVRTAGGALATAAPAHHVAEQVVEHVRKGTREIRIAAGTRSAAAHTAFESGMTETIICSLLFGVLQDLVGLVGFLEVGFGIGLVRIPVRMQFLRLPSICLLDLFGRGILVHAEHIVIVTFGHSASPETAEADPPAADRPITFPVGFKMH